MDAKTSLEILLNYYRSSYNKGIYKGPNLRNGPITRNKDIIILTTFKCSHRRK